MKRKIGAILLIMIVVAIILMPLAAMADPPDSSAPWFKCRGNTVWQAMNCILWAVLHGIDDVELIPF